VCMLVVDRPGKLIRKNPRFLVFFNLKNRKSPNFRFFGVFYFFVQFIIHSNLISYFNRDFSVLSSRHSLDKKNDVT